MTAAHEIIDRLSERGVTLRLEGTDGLRVIGISKLTDQEREVFKVHKAALLEALRQPAETINNRQNETLSRAPWGMYAPNCNRCRRYRWRSANCQRQGPVEFANTPPCGGNDYQPLAPTLTEREAMAGATGENVS